MDYLGVAIFTAMMVATNYTASFLLAAEALWLGGLLLAQWAGSTRAAEVAIFGPGFAVIGGIALLAPLLPGAVCISFTRGRGGSASTGSSCSRSLGRIRCCATWLASPRCSISLSP